MGSNIRILILEDVPLDLELMEAELRRDGINFLSHCVEEEEEYRKSITEFQPDIILADHSLPHFDGISAMYIAQEITPETPFIFVSGQMGEEFAVEMLKKGATDYVLKHNLSKLGHSVKRALKESEEHLNKKRAEERLARSEKKYRALFELSPDYMMVLDPDGHVLDINHRLEEDSGISREDFVGKDANEIARDFVGDQFNNGEITDYLRNHTEPMEIKIEGHGGFEYIEVHHAPIVKEGKIFAIQIIGRNITKRKTAENALIESKKRLHDVNTYLEAIINASPFAIVDLHLDGRVKSLWNPAAENIFGWKRMEVLGKPLPFLNDNKGTMYENIMHNVLSGEFKSDLELECARNDGEQIYTMMATAPLLNVDNNIQGVMATFADISDMIMAEKQIKASLEEKEVLLREIHHRVKNNLQIISSLMSLQSEYTQEPETLKMFQESKNRIRSMALIHEKLYQSGDMAHIDFGEYLKSLVEMLSTFHKEKKDDVKVHLNCEDVFLEIDTAISMGLIVNELVSNCFKHSFPLDRNGEVEINLSKMSGGYLLEVADDGVGLPEGFDLESTGTLGLLIVQTLTMQLRGSLEIKTADKTCFSLFFKE
ncbi:MAG: PAS domain S-box protein [Methanobacterium sp.]|uniref:PAS domain S-box protein n=1 Tax=Methanobacterium sp. TaxID=2164 RepID=UPI002586887D|nr:PAS domain S-box protein [Methanobacterium sp.]MCC7559458.1 PAS domain S-box protein [Methanobacterium sp.]